MRKSEFDRACELWDQNKFKAALKIFMVLAEQGDVGALLNVGYFYDCGIGVKRDSTAALRWYRRAYRMGDAGAANNIGTIYRDRGNVRRAVEWFTRAIDGGEIGSALELAEIELARGNRTLARKYLKHVATSDSVTENDLDTARRMLAELDRT